jgi:ketosteroid isomerase-like protein
MRTTTVQILYATLVGAITSLPVLAASPTGVQSAIEAGEHAFAEAVSKGDSVRLSSLYAEEGQVLEAGSAPIKGRAAIQKYWQAVLGSGIGKVDLTTLEVFSQGATATEVGHYELYDKAGKVIDNGKYIVVWRREGGGWKLLRDMYSTDVAPPHK